MVPDTICLNCGFRFDGQQCPLCCWSALDTPVNQKTDLRITLVFEKENDSEFEHVLEMARTAYHFSSHENETGTRYYATYLPTQASELFQLFEKIETGHRLQILLNGKIRPYTRNLWLPMLWFFMRERQSEPKGEKHGN